MPQPSEVFLPRCPFSDIKEAKLRPGPVLTRPNSQGDFIAAQIKSRIHHVPNVRLQDSDFELGGLPKPSILRPDKVFTLNKDLVVRRVGCLKRPDFFRLLGAICKGLGCRSDAVSDEVGQ